MKIAIILVILNLAVAWASTTADPNSGCNSDPPPCGAQQYCEEFGLTAICRGCDSACNRCTGSGSTNCRECQLGYRNVTGDCQVCPENTYGRNCSGTCRCLLGPEDCDKQTGDCKTFICDQGWTGLGDQCQIPCSNKTFGSNCKYQCHCPVNDTCSPINGLCSSGECAVGWSSAGCQNELPKLNNPPTITNITCGNVTVNWIGWRAGIDRGNQQGIIARYELQSSFYTDLEINAIPWDEVINIPHNDSQTTYSVTVQDLLPDTYYNFRVNVRQKDGDKFQQKIMDGEPSGFVFVQCTVPTTTTSTTPQPGTTFRPPGPHFLDESQFSTEFLSDSVLNVRWEVLDNVTASDLNVTLKYHIYGIGDCANVTDPVINEILVAANGNYNITNLLPWRQYIVNVTAEYIDYNVTDYIQKNILTPEEAPIGVVQDIEVNSITNSSCTVTWTNMPCEERGGRLLNYSVNVFQLPNTTTAAQVYLTRMTSLNLNSLMPYTLYGISVRFINSKGTSDHTNLTTFTTLEDVPGAPSVQSIQAGETWLEVQLGDPDIKNGILREFTVMVSVFYNFTNKLTKSQVYGMGNRINMTNLDPNTLYYVRASASTSVGPGALSEVYNVTTGISTSPPPESISEDLTGRNETCVKLSWQPPVVSGGNVLGYTISYHESGIDLQESDRFNTTNTMAVVCDLTPGRYYDFYVAVLNNAGVGAPIRIQISTEQSDPPVPPQPEVINTTSSTIRVALDPVVSFVPAKPFGYLVFVQQVDPNSVGKRAVSMSNTTCPGVTEIPGYIARNFSHTEIPSRIQFVIGDGVTYGNYTNTALTDTAYYDIYYVIISYFEGVCKYNYTKVSNPIQAVNQAPMVLPQDEEDSNNTSLIVIIIVVIVLLIIIAVVIIFLFLWWRNRQRDQKYEPYVNEKEDHFNLKVFRVDDYNPHKYWNKIYSIRESRYITVGREYLPDNNKTFTNGVAGVEKPGQPILFHDEFAQLPHGRQSTCGTATLRENELKNRFSHLLPYDHSRVILDPIVQGQNDYINANFIKGYKHMHAYIAAQSPFDEETVLDFWRMIYQYEVRCVVMMSNIVEDHIVKCTQYWPEAGRVLYGNFILELVDSSEFANYIIRSVKIRPKTDSEWQQVYLFELSYWPEHGVPEDSIPLLEMRHKVNLYHQGHSSPIVVHCGTGVSRTGVYIAIDALLEQYKNEGMISVFSFVRKMRKDRIAMVRTVKQYIFIYEAVFEAMVAGATLFDCFDLKDRYHVLTQKNHHTGHSYLHGQFSCLQLYTRKLFPTACSEALLPVNVNKNRFHEIVPPDMYRPILTTPGGVGRTDFINAVFIDSHKQYNHYILTQTPLHTTVIDFWKLVYDHDVNTIVMMEPMKYEDDTCAEYWPQNHMKQYEPFFVETTDEYQQENITIRNLKLVCMQKPGEVRHVRQFQFNAWMDTEFIPKSKSMLLDVMDLVQDWQTFNNDNSNPILVHCKDGATHSGLFVAISVLCEQALTDDKVDIFHTIKHIKRRRTQVVDMLDQYRFCYKALWDFINMRLPGGTLTSQMSKTRTERPYSSLSLTSYGTGHDYMPY